MTTTALQRVLTSLENRGLRWRHQSGGYAAQCPAHEDRKPSLMVRNGDGKVLLNCQAHCQTNDVLDALGLTWADLFDTPTDAQPEQLRPSIIATYDYRDATGTVLYQKVRYVPKDFRVRRGDGTGGWIWNIGDDTPRVLYRLPEVIAAVVQGETIFVTEGEKDADRLAALGHCATCNYDGASKDGQRPKWRDSYSDTLTGAHVVIIADNDAAGYAHARAALASLAGKAASVRIVRGAVNSRHADISDHLAAGHTMSDLLPVSADDEPALDTPPDGDPSDEDQVGDPVERIHQHEVAQELRKLRVREEARKLFLAEQEETPAAETTRFVPGGAFIHDTPTQVPAAWGRGEEVLWSLGEPLIITGPTGVGKTTLGGQVVAGRLGLLPTVLGYPVTAGRRVLYLAMDRPVQIARALGRLLRNYEREILDERIVFWRGPPPSDLAAHPGALLELARQADADTVVLDSLKDAAVNLSNEEVGQGLNRAMQMCVAAGIEVIAYHHQTKRGNGGVSKPNSIADVYGSAWITAGAGSVLLLWGEAGDPIVELSHLKQPAGEVGPLQLVNDPAAGTMAIVEGGDVLDLLLSEPRTPREVAVVLYGATKPSSAQVEKARRKIHKLVEKGLAVRLGDPSSGGAGGGRQGGGDGARYGAAQRVGTVHGRSTVSEFPQVRRSTDEITESRSTGTVHGRSTPVHGSDVSAGETVHGTVHARNEPPRSTPDPSPFRGEGEDQRGDHETGTSGTPPGGLDASGDRWVHAYLSNHPQTVGRLATDLDATTGTVEDALARLEAIGHAQRHTQPGEPDSWSLPNRGTQKEVN